MLPITLRTAIAAGAIAPLGFLMGLPMPVALAPLDLAAPTMIPWVWAYQWLRVGSGVLSLATALRMVRGFQYAAVAGMMFPRLPSSAEVPFDGSV